MKVSQIKVNSAAIRSGVWVDIPWLDGVAIKLRGLENVDYQRRRADLIREKAAEAKANGVPPDKLSTMDVEVDAFVECVMLDWRGLTEDDGTPIPYSAEKALEYFKDPDLIDLWNAAYWASQQVRNAKKEQLEEDKGN